MPNWCNFEMRVKGKKRDIEKAYKQIFASDYGDEGRHLHRVHTDFNEFQFNENGIAVINGYCAWSVHSCMFDGEGTYALSEKAKNPNYLGTTIVQISKDFNLIIEICSEETMMGFIEEFVIVYGDVLKNVCYDIHPRYNFTYLY